MRLAAVLLSFLALHASAEQLPAWELGVGFGVYHSPHYLGADQSSTYATPLPVFIYRGEYLRSNRGGLVGDLYKSERLDLRLSASASLPVSSEDNRAREGMPDLDLMFEAGPVLEYKMYESESWLLRADLPLRGAFTIGGDGVAYRGMVSNPRLYARWEMESGWQVTATTGLLYASKRFHEYFYRVEPKYATPDRPAYEVDAGFVATRYSFSLSRYFGDMFIGGFVHGYDLSHAENHDSPLVKKDQYLSAGFAIGWLLRKSDRMVER